MLKKTSRLSLSFTFGAWVIPAGETGKRDSIEEDVVIQSFSPVWLFVTPWTAACQASLPFTISWSLLKLMSIESVMPPNHLILCHPLLLLLSVFPSIRVFSNESAVRIRWPKYWSLIFSISPSNEYSMLIFFRIDWLVGSPCCPRNSQESSLAPQLKGINSSALSLVYCPDLTSIYDYWKNHSFDYMDLCWQCFLTMSLLFNMLFRFFIAVLPKNKHLLISWQWFWSWRK